MKIRLEVKNGSGEEKALLEVLNMLAMSQQTVDF